MTPNATRGGHLLAALRQDREMASRRMQDIAATCRGRSMTDDEQHDHDMAAREVAALDKEIAIVEAKGEPPLPAPTDAVTALYQIQAAAVADLCVKAGAPEMAASLIAEGVSVEEAGKRIAPAAEGRAIAALAGKMSASIPADLAATMLAEGKTLEQVRAEVLGRLAAESDKFELHTQAPPPPGASGAGGGEVDLAADMRRRHGITA